MARMTNAVIGIKNKTWFEVFMLAATLGAVGLSAYIRLGGCRGFARARGHARPRPPVRGASAGRLRRAEKPSAPPAAHTASIPGAGNILGIDEMKVVNRKVIK